MIPENANIFEFAKLLSSQAKDAFPSDIPDNVKDFITETIYKFINLAGKALDEDKENNYTMQQTQIICQLVAEWTFHKGINNYKNMITKNLLATSILQQLAFVVYETARKDILSGADLDTIINNTEKEVSTEYSNIMKNLENDGIPVYNIVVHDNVECSFTTLTNYSDSGIIKKFSCQKESNADNNAEEYKEEKENTIKKIDNEILKKSDFYKYIGDFGKFSLNNKNIDANIPIKEEFLYANQSAPENTCAKQEETEVNIEKNSDKISEKMKILSNSLKEKIKNKYVPPFFFLFLLAIPYIHLSWYINHHFEQFYIIPVITEIFVLGFFSAYFKNFSMKTCTNILFWTILLFYSSLFVKYHPQTLIYFNILNGLFVFTFIMLIIMMINTTKKNNEIEKVKNEMKELVNSDRMYERYGVDILKIEIGKNLISIADPEKGGQFISKICELRRKLTDELGYVMPDVRILDTTVITEYEYLIFVRENVVAKGEVYPGRLMVIEDEWNELGLKVPEDVIVSKDPIYQTQVYWIMPKDIPQNENITATDPTDVIVTHLRECALKYVDEIMSKIDILKIMELVKALDPTLVNDLCPAIISTSDLRKIFVNLIREEVSIKDIIFIFERLCDYARFSKEPDILSERIRTALDRQICLKYVNEENVLYAVNLSQKWEDLLDESCERTELGTMLLLGPEQVQELIETTADTLLRSAEQVGEQPVILCSPRIRLPLFQLLERHIPTVVVISYSELITDIRVEAIDTIGEAAQTDTTENILNFKIPLNNPKE